VWDWSFFLQQIIATWIALAPVDGAVIWLVWTTRTSARRAAQFSEMLPADLPEIAREALAWRMNQIIQGEVEKYVDRKASGTLEEK
jgi:hypothetical protein